MGNHEEDDEWKGGRHTSGGLEMSRRESALAYLRKLYKRTMESERMPDEWRDSVLIPIFKNNGGAQSCSNYIGITLISHTMKLSYRVVERRLGIELTLDLASNNTVSCQGKSLQLHCLL